ncbi:MAG: autotransporter-associated beta strand repeat-containing protein [Pirellulales bacterium]
MTNGANTLTVQGAGSVTLSGVVGAGAGGITMNGSGTLILSGANTYTGTTTIGSGIVQLGTATSLGPAANANVSMTGGTLRLNNFSATLVDLSGTAGTIDTNVAGTPTLTVNKAAGSSTFGGVIANGAAGTLSFTKGGAGALVLGGANTFSGTTRVTAGTLTVSGSMADAMALVLSGTGIYEYQGAAAGSSDTVGGADSQ